MTQIDLQKINSFKPLIGNHSFEKLELPSRMIWSNSSLKLFCKCKRKFFWKTIARLRPRKKATALFVGGYWHKILEEWYKSKRSMKSVTEKMNDEILKEVEQLCDFYDQEEYDKLTSVLDTLSGMGIGYAEIYKSNRKKWVIDKDMVEVKFAIDLGKFDFIGKIDLIAKIKNKITVVEHKSISHLRDSYLDRLPLDSQVRAYIYGGMYGIEGKPPVQVLYDVTKKCKLRRKMSEDLSEFATRVADDYIGRPDFYFFQETLKFSKEDINAFEVWMFQLQRELEHLIEDANNPLDPREWPINDSTCDEYFSTCPYLPLCISGLDKISSRLYEQNDPKKDAEDWLNYEEE